jgi:HK97 gp10 family phage protein
MTKILGLAKLQRKLDRLPRAAVTLIKAAMEERANVIVAIMKSLAPKDRGELADSIGWTWGKLPTGATVLAEVKASLGGDLTITIYAGDEVAYYAGWQEFGTQKMPANPYFYVSWRANRREAGRAMKAAVRKSVKQVAAT